MSGLEFGVFFFGVFDFFFGGWEKVGSIAAVLLSTAPLVFGVPSCTFKEPPPSPRRSHVSTTPWVLSKFHHRLCLL